MWYEPAVGKMASIPQKVTGEAPKKANHKTYHLKAKRGKEKLTKYHEIPFNNLTVVQFCNPSVGFFFYFFFLLFVFVCLTCVPDLTLLIQDGNTRDRMRTGSETLPDASNHKNKKYNKANSLCPHVIETISILLFVSS